MQNRDIDSIVLHHTASPDESMTWEQIRLYHIQERGYMDIGYHWGVVDDGKGWEVKRGRDPELVGAHARGFNRTSIGVCVEGNYSVNHLDDQAYNVLMDLVVHLCEEYGIPPSRVFAHREVGSTPTECPGKLFPLERFRAELRSRVTV